VTGNWRADLASACNRHEYDPALASVVARHRWFSFAGRIGGGASDSPAIRVRCSESVGSPANLGPLTAAVRAGPIVFGDLKRAAGAKVVPIRGVGYAWKAYAIVFAGRGPAVAPGPRPVAVAVTKLLLSERSERPFDSGCGPPS
jgi:hypothetical protein